MADYIEITDEEIQPGAPYTTGLAAKMRDNHLAVAEGAAGAPRVQPAAQGLVAASSSNNNILLRGNNFSGQPSAPNTYQQVYNFRMGQSGTINVAFTQSYTGTGSYDVRVIRVRGGDSTTLQTYSLSSPQTVNRSANYDVLMGDTISIEYRASQISSGAGNKTITNMRLRCTNIIGGWTVLRDA